MRYRLVVGVDPGLVHTGAVAMLFYPNVFRVRVHARVINGPNAEDVKDFINEVQFHFDLTDRDTFTFIEDYRPRSHFDTDNEMTKAVHDMKATLKDSVVLNNTGVKKIVKPELMALLEVWAYTTRSNHQDLRSAARIALLGMLKDEDMNALLSQIVHDHLEGRTWNVLS